MAPIVQTRGLTSGYGAQPVIHDLDIELNPGEVVTMLGPNGAGKTTTLLTLAGELPIMGGEIHMEGMPAKAPLHKKAKLGLGFVTEERSVFKGLSAMDNFRAGGIDHKEALELFPELEKRLTVRGGLLSGGEQQMLTLGRALARHPKILLADELSLGLAPLVVDRLLKAVQTAAKERGTAVLLVEQHARKALQFADRVYVMRRGRIMMSTTAADARARISEIEDSYLTSAVEELPA
jgi:branched-chain amino acid transport system ATP-binding protein